MLTPRLSQYLEWNQRKSNTRRIFLFRLSDALTVPHNQHRSQESQLMPKVKLAVLSLGYQVPLWIVKDLSTNTHTNQIKRRCYLCLAKVERKVRRICDNCGQKCLFFAFRQHRSSSLSNMRKKELKISRKLSNNNNLIHLAETFLF